MVLLNLIWPIISTILFGAPILILWAYPAIAETVADYTPAKERAWEHVQTVLMSSEYGGRSGVIERWVNSPSISIVGASRPDELFLRELISNWNEILGESPVQLRHSEEPQADIGVVFSERANFAVISGMYGFQIVEGGPPSLRSYTTLLDRLTIRRIFPLVYYSKTGTHHQPRQSSRWLIGNYLNFYICILSQETDRPKCRMRSTNFGMA